MMALEWVPVSITIGLFSFFLTVLVHMAAKALNIQGAEMWSKSEYAQVAVTFLIIFFAAALQTAGAAALAKVTQSVAAASTNADLLASIPGTNNDPVMISKEYIGRLVDCEVNIYRIVYWRNLWVEPVSRLSFDVIGSEPVAGNYALSGYTSLFHYIMNNVVYLVLYHYIQYNALLFSQYTMLGVFLPLGLVLRSFAPTRGAGGFVTAFALGFAFVFPMSYVIIVALMPNTSNVCHDLSSQTDPILGMANPCFNSLGKVMTAFFEVKGLLSTMFALVTSLQSTLNMLYLQALFYPLASLIITFSFIRQMGNLLGADLAEIGRGLIKII